MDFRRMIGWLLVLSAMSACARPPAAGQTEGRDMAPTLPVSSWCEGTSLEEARSDAPLDLAIPRTAVASVGTLSAVWECPSGEFVLEFATGVSVWYGFNDLDDPVATWHRMDETYREFAVGDVHGVPASLADPAVDSAIGGVDWVVSGVRYTVSGNGEIPLDDLIDVARSMPVPTS